MPRTKNFHRTLTEHWAGHAQLYSRYSRRMKRWFTQHHAVMRLGLFGWLNAWAKDG